MIIVRCIFHIFNKAHMPRLQWLQEYGAFSSMCHSFHSSRIVGLDAIMQQPLLVAVGADRSVRVWDYVRRTCIVTKQLVDEPLCCSLHPGGFLLLLGTHEKLRLLYILKVNSQFPVLCGRCTQCCSSCMPGDDMLQHTNSVCMFLPSICIGDHDVPLHRIYLSGHLQC